MDARTVLDFLRTLCTDLDAGRTPRMGAFGRTAARTVGPAVIGISQALAIGCGGAQTAENDTVLVVTPTQVVRYAEVCNDGVDNDLDSLLDCADADCAGLALCAPPVALYAAPVAPYAPPPVAPAPPSREVCNDGVDNDRDGLTDCGDADCARLTYCAPSVTLYGVPITPPVGPEVCTDGIDNDRDGLVDLADSDCGSMPEYAAVFTRPEDCDDGVDNDRDGATDCGDADCRNVSGCFAVAPAYGVPFVRAEICGDGVDNDRDGRTDCADSDCACGPVARYGVPFPR
jgi:hypothetical protein